MSCSFFLSRLLCGSRIVSFILAWPDDLSFTPSILFLPLRHASQHLSLLCVFRCQQLPREHWDSVHLGACAIAPPPPHLPCLPLHFHTHSIYTAVAAPARWNVNLAPLVFAPTLISGLRLADGCLYSQVYPAVMQTPFLHLSRAEWCPCVNLPQSCFNLPVSCVVSSAVDSEQVESTHTKPQCYFETHLRTCRLSLAWKIGP